MQWEGRKRKWIDGERGKEQDAGREKGGGGEKRRDRREYGHWLRNSGHLTVMRGGRRKGEGKS